MTLQTDQKLVNALNDCVAACNECAIACLEEQEVKRLTKCIRLDIDCSAICQALTGFITRSSEHAMHLLRECAEICDACAEECRVHEHMGHCRYCAETCASCADICRRKMAA